MAASPKIAIIGAGLTGALAAYGLQKQGFSATIFERDPSISSRNIRDWTILIHWGLPPLLALLPPPVAAKLPGAICNPTLDFSADGVETLPCFNGLTGERLFASPTPGARRFNRQRLRRVLLGVDGDGGEVAEGGLDVRWGKRLVALEATDDGDGPVTLLFADGDTFEADYVLGADGPNSTVRELLFAGGGSDDAAAAAKAVGSGFMIASCCPRYRDAEKARFIEAAHPVAAIMMGPSVVGGCGPMYTDVDPADPATWTMFWVKIWRGEPVNLTGQEALDYIRRTSLADDNAARGICEPFKSAMAWTPDGTDCWIDEMKYWIPVRWPNLAGRVTLAGDAAHPMLPFRGQGMQHAITDAGNFVNALAKVREGGGDVELRREVVDELDAELVARGAVAVKQALAEADKSLDPESVGKMLMARQGHVRTA